MQRKRSIVEQEIEAPEWLEEADLHVEYVDDPYVIAMAPSRSSARDRGGVLRLPGHADVAPGTL
jgi:hypothetical protein